MSDVKLNDKDMWIKQDKAFIEWLQAQSKGYQRKCREHMKLFIEYLNENYPEKELTTATTILKLRKEQDKSDDKKSKHWFADEIPKFVDWLIETKGIKSDSAVSYASPVRGFFSYHRYPLQIRKGALPEIEGTVGDHKLTQSQLKKMVAVGDIKDRSILLVGKDLGLRAGDFARLERSLILPQIERARKEGVEPDYPLEFELMTHKEKAPACCHIMRETAEALLTYWETCPGSIYWFPNGKGGHISEDQLNYTLRKLWSVAYDDPEIFETPAGIGKKTSGRLRWHAFRDFLISAMANANINKWAVKFMVGKKVSKDMKEYLSGLDKKALFKQVEPRIVLTGLTNMNHSRLDDVQKEMDELRDTLKTFARLVAKEMEKQGMLISKDMRQAMERISKEKV